MTNENSENVKLLEENVEQKEKDVNGPILCKNHLSDFQQSLHLTCQWTPQKWKKPIFHISCLSHFSQCVN